MDNFVSEKLKEWKLDSLTEVFEENGIDEEAFLLLDVETVKELIKPVGPRMKFLAQWNKLYASKLPHAPSSPASEKDLSCPNIAESTTPSCSPRPSQLASESDTETPRKKFKSTFNVRGLLEENSEVGKSIIAEIERGELTRKSRLHMVRIVVAHIIQHYGDRPKCEVKARMAKAVIEEFPSLKDDEGQGFEAWYTPGRGRHSSSGWIEERLRNVRRSYSSVPSSPDTTTSTSSSLINAKLPECDLTSDECESMVEWLKHNITPLSQVNSFMEKTAVKRAGSIRLNHQPLNEVIKEYPRLFDTPGMVELDFRVLFADVADKLYMVWTPTYAEEVLKYASLQGNWQSYLNISTTTLPSDDKKISVSLAVLPCILPAGRKGKKRASVDESKNSFTDIQPIGTNMPKYLEEVTNKQPYILILGTLLEQSQCFVIVERKALQQESLLKAVDVCFKLFYVLDVNYPWQCYTTWEYFQKVVYGLEDSGGRKKTATAVIAMRTALKKSL